MSKGKSSHKTHKWDTPRTRSHALKLQDDGVERTTTDALAYGVNHYGVHAHGDVSR